MVRVGSLEGARDVAVGCGSTAATRYRYLVKWEHVSRCPISDFSLSSRTSPRIVHHVKLVSGRLRGRPDSNRPPRVGEDKQRSGVFRSPLGSCCENSFVVDRRASGSDLSNVYQQTPFVSWGCMPSDEIATSVSCPSGAAQQLFWSPPSMCEPRLCLIWGPRVAGGWGERVGLT